MGLRNIADGSECPRATAATKPKASLPVDSSSGAAGVRSAWHCRWLSCLAPPPSNLRSMVPLPTPEQVRDREDESSALATRAGKPISPFMSYDTDLQLFIDGVWKSGEGRDAHPVVNPVTASEIAEVPYATKHDLE